MRVRSIVLWACLLAASPLRAADGNRLTYLDGNDPYYAGLGFPKLTTPQWVGENGVDAVVVLAIDDLGENAPKYEAFLRPILDRLKRIDGRAPVSIMTCRVDRKDPQVQAWLKEGVNLDVHTLTHPCPLLQKGDLEAATKSYHGCVDLLAKVPGNKPVAFRMPCCDSQNTVSPRFFAELFNATSAEGRFLSIDSSVFQLFTPADPALPRELVEEPDGRERFRKYLPFPSFVNTIENYPYPYVIGRLCWEFPCMVPSDWEAQHLNKPNSPKTVEDMKAALDAVVAKGGVFNLVFHPHNWIKSEQIVELIDHAVTKHGKKVKFLNFGEAQQRLEKNLLGGQSLRNARGGDNGVRVLDLDNDGFLDVLIGNDQVKKTRRWDPSTGRWIDGPLPTSFVTPDEQGHGRDLGVRFGIVRADGHATMLFRNEAGEGAWSYGREGWEEDRSLLAGLVLRSDVPMRTSVAGRDVGVRLRDFDGDGVCELIGGAHGKDAELPKRIGTNATFPPLFAWSAERRAWARLPFTLPMGLIVDRDGHDAGVRFVDLDEDGRDDVIWSSDSGSGIALFESMQKGWSRIVMGDGRQQVVGTNISKPEETLPAITRNPGNGSENLGFWVHSRHFWWQNEHTAAMPDLVDRRSFNDLLKDVEPRGKSVEASRRSIRVRPGFRVEVVASEPLVGDPIAFDWGADGKLWVVEMGDYPLGADGKGKPGGVVKFLEDNDRDGRYDKATVFLDGLSFPTGIMPWRKGVLVSCAPEIFYAEDTNGDGRADVKKPLYTGFGEGNPQHRVNGFELGLDGWIYGANGDSGGGIRSVATGALVRIAGRDFRFRPDTGDFEAASGQAQYGRRRDDWGHWFGNNNSVWAWQYVLAEHDLARNPRFAPPDPKLILEHDRQLFPVSPIVARFNDLDNAGRVTSANSPTPYRDDLFGPGFENAIFVSEPVHNLVHRLVVSPDGSALRGGRFADETDREFLASSDNWFRPTTLHTGPDGALWVADMYRAVIEHPEWIPDDWEAKLDLRAGWDQGRIYRILPVDRAPRPIPRLDTLDTSGLVAAMDSPNGWTRDTVERLLIERNDRAALEPLRRLSAASERPKVRLQAVWTLQCLGGLDPATVCARLADAHPEVPRNALQAGENLLGRDRALGQAALTLADDADASVRLQAALSLGQWSDAAAGRALARVALRDRDDAWIRAAVLSSAGPHAATLAETLFAEAGTEPPPAALIEPLMATLLARPDPNELVALYKRIGTSGHDGKFADWQLAAAAGLADARARVPEARQPQLAGAIDAAQRGLTLWNAAARIAQDESEPPARRALAVRLLAADVFSDQTRAELAQLLKPQVAATLQQAAVAVLGRSRDPLVPATLLADWKAHAPALRSAILDVLLSRDAWSSALLASLESGRVLPAEIDPTHRRRLMNRRDPAERARAEAVFAGATPGRKEVLDRYRPALAHDGDPAAGAAVFKRVCAVCHRLNGVGTEVGADLAALTDKSPEALLIAILDPNRAFEAKFTNFLVQTTDGRVLSGMIAAETANSVTLRRQEGKEDALLRSEIEEMAASGQSLMPEGLEKDVTPHDLSDLIAYLASTGPPRKIVEGNTPELLRPDAEGILRLPARAAEIYGETLTFETRYSNLGYWSAINDRAVWRLDVERPGRYEVWLEYACANESAGNRYVVEAASAQLAGTIAGTGSWDEYRRTKLGEITLPAGRQRLEVRPAGRVRGALMDLRAIELRPVP